MKTRLIFGPALKYIVPPLAFMTGALWAKRGKQSILRKMRDKCKAHDEGWEKKIMFFSFPDIDLTVKAKCRFLIFSLGCYKCMYGYCTCDIKILSSKTPHFQREVKIMQNHCWDKVSFIWNLWDKKISFMSKTLHLRFSVMSK